MQEALLRWSAQRRRDLPWRRTRDPWAVLVSELMLQQTQVSRVVPRYAAFLEQFPDAATCARADAGTVVRAWAGLGYNRRAVHLHAAARQVVAHHGGTLPADLEGLLGLPGVGPYTARAVLSFAFERDVGVVDTNAARVLARAVVGRPVRGLARAQQIADGLVPPGAGWAWNQAVLDLGATVCVARSPRCQACPVMSSCAWHRAGRPWPDPAVGSAATGSRQGSFEGSDRQGRGRLVAALRTGPLAWRPDVLAAAAGWPGERERAERAARSLVADGLAELVDGSLRLPV